jgi:hypothetical protein
VDYEIVVFPGEVDLEPTPAPVEQVYDIPALVAEVADLKARLAALESPEPTAPDEPTLWGYKVGDLVKYTRVGLGPTGEVRTVRVVDDGPWARRLRLGIPDDNRETGYAYSAVEIEPA